MSQPIFQSVFADSWDQMPPLMHKYYANRPYSHDAVTVEGKMDIEFGWLLKLYAPLFRMFGVVAFCNASGIPVTMQFLSEPDSNACCAKCTLNFPDKKPHIGYSRMIPVGGNEAIEFMKHGIGCRYRFLFENGKVMQYHRGYVWKIFGKILPLPISLFMGNSYAEEEVLSDDSFRMKITMTHPLFGMLYKYRGNSR